VRKPRIVNRQRDGGRANLVVIQKAKDGTVTLADLVGAGATQKGAAICSAGRQRDHNILNDRQ